MFFLASSSFSPSEIALFAVLVTVFLTLDIKTGDQNKPVPMKKALLWSVIWVVVSMGFAGYVAWDDHPQQAVTFITAYFLEKTLAVDNLFVFMAIFSSFAVAEKLHHRILHWGIIGALVFRGLFIGLGVGILFGAGAIEHITVAGIFIHPVNLVFFIFGLLVLWSAYTLLKASLENNGSKENEEEQDYTDHWSVRFLRKIFPDRISTFLDGHKFFTHIHLPGGTEKVLAVTPLFLCLLVIEISDIMFAFDSVPAIFAITREPYLVYTSNIFAVLGLRSMYFLVAAAKRHLCHLEKAVIFILAFIGFKMITFQWLHVPPLVSLSVVLGSLGLGIVASFVWPEKEDNGLIPSEMSELAVSTETEAD